jgi:hypothetical protein
LGREQALDEADGAGWLERLRVFWQASPTAAWSFAAAVACVLLAAGITLRNDSALSPLNGSGVSAPVYRATQIELTSPVGEIGALPASFDWTGSDEAAAYRLRVMEVDETVVWEGQSAEPRLTTPDELASIAVPGKTLLWQVQALDAADSVVAESDLERFVIPVEVAP